jgi:tetratricopeptide (TPR) repeat protein
MTTLDDAIRKLEQGRLQEGQRMLEQLRKEDPDNPALLYNLGICYSEQGQLEASIEALERCLEVAPDHINAYAALGFSYARAGQLSKAVEVLEAAREQAPQNFYMLKNLGSLYGQLGRLDEAVACLEVANEVNPNVPEVLYGLAYAYERQGSIDTADLIYEKLINMGESEPIVELAEEGRTRIGMESLKAQGVRLDAVMYCLGALQKFSGMSSAEIQRITFEIAMLGRSGLDINTPKAKYTLESLPGDFTGLQLLCYMYVGFQLIDPSVDIGADLHEEYETALKIFEARTG